MRIQFVEFKGVKLGVFWDVNNSECSFQADKINNNELLWLGVNVDTTGQQGFRMLLDKGTTAVLIEIMKQFLETGKTPTSPEEMPKSVKNNLAAKENNDNLKTDKNE